MAPSGGTPPAVLLVSVSKLVLTRFDAVGVFFFVVVVFIHSSEFENRNKQSCLFKRSIFSTTSTDQHSEHVTLKPGGSMLMQHSFFPTNPLVTTL